MPEKKTCPTCKKVVSCQSSLTRHIAAKHTKIKAYKCEHSGCDWAYVTNSDLQRHIDGVHNKLKPHRCPKPKCKSAYHKKSDLTNHIKNKHDNIRDFVCTELLDGVPCLKAFHNNVKLRRHLRETHTKEKTVPCSKCGKLFKSKDSRNKHIQYAHLKILRFSCDIGTCDYRCYDKFRLKNHKKICTGGLHGSFGEIMIKTVLIKLKIKFIHDKAYELIGNHGSPLRWDFVILTDDDPLFIEFDGQQHFSPQRYGGRSMKKSKIAFIKQQKNDKLKNDYCDDNGYLLKRIPYTKVDEIEPLVKTFIATHTIGYLANPYE
jgi:uncharacterized C2H2 Zn-finger protein